MIAGDGAAEVVIAPSLLAAGFTLEAARRVDDAADWLHVDIMDNQFVPNHTIGLDEVRSLRAQLPSHVLLVLDAAYAEYVRRNDYEAGIELVATTQNTVFTRLWPQSPAHGAKLATSSVSGIRIAKFFEQPK